MKQFHGSIDELKAAVAACTLSGEWSEVNQNGLHCFRAKTGEVLNWSKTATEADRQPRARQNVILEMGMVMAALSRARMVILKKGALEMASDAAGIIYIEFNDHVREIFPKLAQRLGTAGFDIDPQKIAAA